MQQDVPAGDVFQPSARVMLGDLEVDASAVSVTREIPDPYSSFGGYSAADGKVTATYGADVTSVLPTPWDANRQWPPTPEAPAQISMGVGPGDVRSLTGRVVEASGGTDGRDVDVEISDLYETLEREISWGALSDTMPSPVEGEQPRYIGLHSMALTDRIFRHCGWYATPPKLGYTVFSVPAMGTMWPEVGTLRTSNGWDGSSNPATSPFFNATEWGVGANRVLATYDITSYTLDDRPHLEMVALADEITGMEGQGSGMYFDVSTAGNQRLRITWTNSVVNVWTTNPDGASVLAASASTTPAPHMYYVKVDRVSATQIRCELIIDGESRNTRTVTVHSGVISSPFRTATIRGDKMGGGFQLAYPGGTAHLLDTWEPNAVIHKSGTSHMLKVVPPVEGENCASLLKEQCAAEGGTFWIDENGVMQWWHLWYLEREDNVATLTGDDHITDGGFTWLQDRSSVKSRVKVKWKDRSLTQSSRSKVDLWQGSGTTMENGDSVQEFIEMPTDEVWLQPDLEFTRIGDGAGAGATTTEFNNGNRSWWGGVVQDGDEWAYPGNGSLAFAFERINDATFKYTMRWEGTGRVELKTPNAAAATNVSRNKRSMYLPVFRGKAKYTLTNMTYTAEQTGPDTAPEYVIDAGWWVQSEVQAQRVADYVAGRLCVPHPELSAMQIVMIPGIQLGDVVTVRDTEVARITVRGIVVEDSRSIDSGMGVKHTVTIRPLAVTRNGVTWEEWGEYVNPETWQGWGTDQQPKTWTQWGSDPLAD